MSLPVKVSLSHQLGRAEARRRIETGFSNIAGQVLGARASLQRWDGDQLSFSVALMGQTISGTVTVLDASVVIEIALPGLLGMIASGLKGRLQKAGQLLLTKK